MLFYLHNLSNEDLIFNDIGLIVPEDGYFIIETPSINDFLREGSTLREAIKNDTTYTYNTDFVVSRNSDVAITTDFLTSTEALPALTNGPAKEVFFENQNNGFLAENVQDAIEEVQNKVSGLTWRAPVLAITSDNQLSGGGTIDISGLTLPFSDDDLPKNLDSGDLTEGTYILYKGATAGDDKLYKVIGTDLVEKEDINGLNNGYAFVVEHDLLEDVHADENAAIYIFTDEDGLQRIASVNWGEAAGLKSYSNVGDFTTAKSSASISFKVGEVVYIQDVNRFVEVLTNTNDAVEDTDWSYIGGQNNQIGGPEYVFNTEVVFDVKDNSSSEIHGATYYDSDVSTLMVYDSNRSKFISISKNLLQFGSSHANGQYLSINGVISGLTGFLIPYDSVITKITVIGTGNLTKEFEIRVNGTNLTTFSLVDGKYSSTDANFNITDGDYLQFFASPGGSPARNVVATIELAYRK